MVYSFSKITSSNLLQKLAFILVGILTFIIGFYLPFIIDPVSKFSGVIIDKNNLPRAFIVLSGSMEPSIRTGSLVFTLPKSFYKDGDIITFHAGGVPKEGSKKNMVTHRITAKENSDGVITGSIYQTKGDANKEADTARVQEKAIVGKVYLAVPYLGYLANYAKSPKGFIFFVIVPATIVIYEEIKFLLGEVRKNTSKIIPKIFKKEKSEYQKLTVNYGLLKVVAIIPIVGALLFLIAFSSSYLSDREESIRNLLGAWGNFEEEITLPVDYTLSANLDEKPEVLEESREEVSNVDTTWPETVTTEGSLLISPMEIPTPSVVEQE